MEILRDKDGNPIKIDKVPRSGFYCPHTRNVFFVKDGIDYCRRELNVGDDGRCLVCGQVPIADEPAVEKPIVVHRTG